MVESRLQLYCTVLLNLLQIQFCLRRVRQMAPRYAVVETAVFPLTWGAREGPGRSGTNLRGPPSIGTPSG